MKLIDSIIESKTRCIIISPHFDDAVLSCAGLLTKIVGKTDVTIVNVFTKAHSGPYSLSARKFLKDSGKYKDATVLFKDRLKEDSHVLSKLRLKAINLGLTDAIFRRKEKRNIFINLIPELNHIYPTYRWHAVRKISSKDIAPALLKKMLNKFNKEDALVFAPLGIGNHVDHLIVRKVCEELFSNLILYSDFPYNLRTNNYKLDELNQKKIELEPNYDKKSKLIKLYKTQFKGLFPDNEIPYHKEIYFLRKKK